MRKPLILGSIISSDWPDGRLGHRPLLHSLAGSTVRQFTLSCSLRCLRVAGGPSSYSGLFQSFCSGVMTKSGIPCNTRNGDVSSGAPAPESDDRFVGRGNHMRNLFDLCLDFQDLSTSCFQRAGIAWRISIYILISSVPERYLRGSRKSGWTRGAND